MLALTSDNMATQPAQQSPQDGTDRRRTLASIECLDPASPSLRKSSLTGTVTDLTGASDDEDSVGAIYSRSPSPGQVQMRSGTNGGGLHIKRARKRASGVKDDLEQATSASRTESEEVKVKLEPEDDLNDVFLSGMEASNSQESYHDAESFAEPSSGTVANMVEVGTLSTDQQQTSDVASEGLELPIGRDW